MKIALAQIDMRLGDIEGICARIESQAILAHEQGARVLCTPSPLLSGLVPGSLVEEENFEHDLLAALGTLAGRLAAIDVIALVPAIVAFAGSSLFEVFMLKEGRVIPVRTLLAARRMGALDELWVPPIFDVDGVRIAVTFDLMRDLEGLPTGCDLVVFFQSNAFEVANEVSAAVAAVPDGHFASEVASKGVWMACMAPVGGFDEAAFTGGSFVMDDGGRVVAAAPCFEEALLVQEIRRGEVLPAIEPHELPQYHREEWLWEALRLHLRDTVFALGGSRAVLLLEGDLPSSLAAALAVDALGSRNVSGVLVERADASTPAREDAERARRERVRALARGLGIHLVERAPIDAAQLVDRDVPQADVARLRQRIEGLCLEETAEELGACPVSSLTKTDAALAAPALARGFTGMVAPFGDVYLTALEFVARVRNRAGSAIPAELVTLNAVEDRMAEILACAVSAFRGIEGFSAQAMQLLEGLEPSQIDGILEAHVDRGRALEDLPLAGSTRGAAAAGLVLMLVRAGEMARRRLPLAPIVSSCSFAERAWPMTLGWSDTGRRGAERLSAADLAQAELARFVERGEEHGERVRGEIMNIIAGFLGLSVDQLEGSTVEEELMKRFRRLQEGFEDGSGPQGPGPRGPFEPGAVPPGTHPHGFSFFSQN